jgi:hypothetical protein
MDTIPDLKGLVMTIENYFFYTVVIVMPLFAVISIANRLRVEKPLLAVHHGVLFGFPFLPSVYAAVQLVCIVISYMIHDEESVTKFSLYLIASAFWFIGSGASEQRILTESGILLSINRQSKSLLRWNDITDYFSKPKEHFVEYHFFRKSASRSPQKGHRDGKNARWNVVVIRVQNRQKAEFDAIIKEKLEPRFDVDPVKIYKSEFKP